MFFVMSFVLYARWTHAKSEAGFAAGNRNKIFAIVELSPDRGGLIGTDISYPGRNEDGCVSMLSLQIWLSPTIYFKGLSRDIII